MLHKPNDSRTQDQVDGEARFGCLGAPVTWAKSIFRRTPANIDPGAQMHHIGDQGVLVATVAKKEIGNTPDAITIHLQFDKNFIGLETFELPLHKNPRNETASWRAVNEGEKVKIRYHIDDDYKIRLIMSPEPF